MNGPVMNPTLANPAIGTALGVKRGRLLERLKVTTLEEELTYLNMIQLEKATRLAAMPADRQLDSLPSGCDKPFEIADGFGNWCRWVLQAKGVVLTDEQRSCLSSLDLRFDNMSGEHNARLWTEAAVRFNPEWDGARREARKVMESFGWTVDE